MSPLPTGTRFPIQVISTIKPANGAAIPVVSDVDMEGGYQVRTDLTDRDSIPANNRKVGMLVFVQSDGYFYTLSGGIDNVDWVVKDFGGGGGGTLAGDVTGPAGSNTVTAINGVAIDTVTAPTQGGSLHYIQGVDLTLFPAPQAMLTDGTNVWTGNYRDPHITKTNLTTRVSYNIDLSSFMPGVVNTRFIRNIKHTTLYSNYLFLATMDGNRVLIMDKTTDAIVGIGDTGVSGERVRCIEIDNLGNVWAGGHNINSVLYRFNIASMISSYPTPASPLSTVSLSFSAEEMDFDGTYIWAVNTSGTIIKIDPTGSGTNLGEYTDGTWYADVLVGSDGNIYVLNQQNTTVLRFNPTTWTSGPTGTVSVLNFSYMNAFCESNGFLWIPDNSSGSGGTNDSVAIVQLSPFQFVGNVGRPGTETEWFEAAPHPTQNKIYIAVYADSTSGQKGFRVMDTSLETFIDSFTQIGPPTLKYIPASCTNLARPANPFVGQMVFITDLDTPGPIAVWWNGSNWVDDQGFTR